MDKKELVGIRKVVDNWKMYEEYGIEDEEGYDENGMRKATGCMGEEFYYMVEDGLITRDSIDHLGEIIRGKKPGRKSDDEIILLPLKECRLRTLHGGLKFTAMPSTMALVRS